SCSTDCAGAVAMSSAVTVALGGEVAGAGCAPAAGVFRWAQPEPSPRNRLNGSTARSENEFIGVLLGHATLQYTTWRGSWRTLNGRMEHVPVDALSEPTAPAIRHLHAWVGPVQASVNIAGRSEAGDVWYQR